ncbi:MAG: hypothetical protein PHV82_19265 [Victivallaceae bacterium]|nr:hypothetical protein [Victivallaceae bacterium]
MKKMILTLMAVSCMFITGCGNNSQLEESAKPLVYQILKEELGHNSAECVAVKITEKVSDDFYKAKATLSNGNDIKITIQQKGDMVYVTIPNQQ